MAIKKELETIKEFWRKQVTDEIFPLQIHADYLEGEHEESVRNRLFYDLSNISLNNAIIDKKTTFMIFCCLMYKLSGMNKYRVGILDCENIYHNLVNLLPLNIEIESHQTMKQFMNKITSSIEESKEYSCDLMESLFKDINMMEPIVYTDGSILNIGKDILDKFKLIFSVERRKEALQLCIDYNTGLYKQETINKLFTYYHTIYKAYINDDSTLIKKIKIISAQEENIILRQWNHTNDKLFGTLTIGQRFAEMAEEMKTAAAVVAADKTYSYKELDIRSNQISNYLIKKGVKPGDIIGVAADKSADIIVGLLAIMKADAAYMPVSDRYPEQRINYMIDNCQVKYMIINESGIRDMRLTCEMININDIELEMYSGELPKTSLQGSDLAYVIYTSGSTGVPKGVMVNHESVIRLVEDKSYITLRKGWNFLQTSSLTFDVSVYEIWGSLLNGLTVHIVSEEELLDISLLKRKVIHNKIDIAFFTTPVFHQIAAGDATVFQYMNYVVAAGDVLSRKHADKVSSANSDIVIVNAYGPTENTTFSTAYVYDGSYKEYVPIGKPIDHSTAYILDRDDQLQPVGLVGEICLGGRGVARGYAGSPELTDSRFVDDPYGNGKMYRSGDLGRWLPDGNIQFLGRVDNQIKINGFRIELLDIKNALLEFDEIQECYVTTALYEENKYLTAYIRGEDIDVEALRDKSGRVLPDYMIPNFFICVDKFALNANGKIDTTQLVSLEEFLRSRKKQMDSELKPNEKLLLGIWTKILGSSEISVLDEFQRLGGTSIMSIRILNEIKRAGFTVNTKEFLRRKTIKDIADIIQPK